MISNGSHDELPPECTHPQHCQRTGVEWQQSFADPDDPDPEDEIEAKAIAAWKDDPAPEYEKPICPIYYQCRHCPAWTSQEPESYFE